MAIIPLQKAAGNERQFPSASFENVESQFPGDGCISHSPGITHHTGAAVHRFVCAARAGKPAAANAALLHRGEVQTLGGYPLDSQLGFQSFRNWPLGVHVYRGLLMLSISCGTRLARIEAGGPAIAISYRSVLWRGIRPKTEQADVPAQRKYGANAGAVLINAHQVFGVDNELQISESLKIGPVAADDDHRQGNYEGRRRSRHRADDSLPSRGPIEPISV